MNNNEISAPESQVCLAESGKFIAFWRGKLVHKLDGALRYFESENAAWGFLARRDAVSASIVGAGTMQRAGRSKPTDRL
jgi:hypothetical protein